MSSPPYTTRPRAFNILTTAARVPSAWWPGAGRGRANTLWSALLACGVLLLVVLTAWCLPQAGLQTHLDQRSLAPQVGHWFGTDPLGRDMFTRTVKGLLVSLQVGLLSATLAGAVATLLGVVSALHRGADRVVGVLIDLTLALPHFVLLILVSFALGGGTRGVVIAVIVSHWPTLARVVRAEVRQVLTAQYVLMARHLGRSRWQIARQHVWPHVLPQMLVGTVLLFPHAILHEAGLTFIGFGLEPHLPAIGILLSEAMRHLNAGLWWLAVLPGMSLLLMVLMFERVASGLRLLTDPRRAQD